MQKNICIYCSSSDAVEPIFFDTAKELATLIATRGHTLVYGGASVGLMGEVAKSAHSAGGQVIGVIPEGIAKMGIAYEKADKFIVTRDMRERKATMEMHSDAFVALPGGFGTLEEIFEMITLKQLQFHNKPLVFLNINNFYNPLFELFEHIYKHKFAKPESGKLFHIAPDAQSAVKYIEEYVPETLATKWFQVEDKV